MKTPFYGVTFRAEYKSDIILFPIWGTYTQDMPTFTTKIPPFCKKKIMLGSNKSYTNLKESVLKVQHLRQA